MREDKGRTAVVSLRRLSARRANGSARARGLYDQRNRHGAVGAVVVNPATNKIYALMPSSDSVWMRKHHCNDDDGWNVPVAIAVNEATRSMVNGS